MRGTVQVAGWDGLVKRITPAHAGNSTHDNLIARHREDHPRSCGEQYAYFCKPPSKLGSPPLMRGTVIGKGKAVTAARITPAHAGNRVKFKLGEDRK